MSQIIRLANHAPTHFTGWKRTTIDFEPPFPAGQVGNATTGVGLATYVVGRRIGLATHTIDVRCSLAPGQRLEIDLAMATEIDFVLTPLPLNPAMHFGGPPSVGTVPAEIVWAEPDGASWFITMRAHNSGMIGSYVWLNYYPGQPWATGDALTVASNPAVTAMGETVLAEYNLRIGDAGIVWPGRVGPIIPGGTYLADGQGKASPFVAIWIRHVSAATDWASMAAAVSWGVGAVGVQSLLEGGAPLMPEGFSGREWAAKLWPEAVRRLTTWDPAVCGPPGISGSAGEQEDSLFHAGGEAMVADGVGAETIRLLSALKLYAERPCNHLEADGSWLDVDRHPTLLFWDGRAHWHAGVSPDRLGKPRNLLPEEAHDRWGPDVQHTYVRTLVAAARLTGSAACQQLMRNLCTVYLLQRTSNPAWSTSGYESAREWGCEGQFVLDMHRDLEDRGMAARVVARWRERVERILIPRMTGKDLMVVFANDPRVNPIGDGAQWWQESFASYLIDHACEIVGPVAGREVAIRIARRVLDVAWQWHDSDFDLADAPAPRQVFADPELQAIHEAHESEAIGDAVEEPHWRAQPQGPLDGSANDANPSTDSFNAYGMPLCAATVLRHEPTNTKARAVWAQCLAAPGDKARRWLPPGVPFGDQ